MNLGKGIRQKSPAWIWLVLLIGCAIVLPGAAWIDAQETVNNSKSFESNVHDSAVTENPSIEFQVTIAHLAESEVAKLGIDWKFENLEINESPESEAVKTGIASNAVDRAIPTGIAQLDSKQLQTATDALASIGRKFDHRKFDTNKVMARVGLTGSLLIGGEVPATGPDESIQFRFFGTQLKLKPTKSDLEGVHFNGELKISKFDKELLAEQEPEGIDQFPSMSHAIIAGPLAAKPGETVAIRSQCDCGTGTLTPIIVLITPRERSRTGNDVSVHRPAKPDESEPLVVKSRVSTRPQQFIFRDSKSNHYQIRDSVTICSVQDDITVSQGQTQNYKFAVEIPEFLIEKPEVVKLEIVSARDAVFTGLKPGKTACTVKASDGSTSTFDITVTENPLPDDREESTAPIPVIARIGGQCSIIVPHEISDYAVTDTDLIEVEKVNDRFIALRGSTPGSTTVVVNQKNGQSLQFSVSVTGKPIKNPGVWISCDDADRDDPSSHKIVKIAGREVTVSENVAVEEADGTFELTGRNMLWTNDDEVMLSADHATIAFSESTQSQRFRLKGTAKFYSGPKAVMEADEINYDQDPNQISIELKSNARMTCSENAFAASNPFEATADRILFDGTKIQFIGNAKLTQTTPDGKEKISAGHEIRMSESGDIEIIAPAKPADK